MFFNDDMCKQPFFINYTHTCSLHVLYTSLIKSCHSNSVRSSCSSQRQQPLRQLRHPGACISIPVMS